jgi:hypothetical protein
MQAQLINTDYMFKYTIVDDNVDVNLITKHIWKSQDLNIQATLGENLYTRIMTDCPNFTGAYLTLVKSYIQPALAEWTVYHLMPFINFRLTNKAVSLKNSDNSNPSTIDDLKWLRDQVRNNAEFYSERIRDYIKNNQSSFPEYFVKNNVFEITPNRTNYFSGIRTSGFRSSRYPGPAFGNIDPCDTCD